MENVPMHRLPYASSGAYHKNLFASLWKDRTLYIFIAPAFIAVLVFNYIPIWGLMMAFQEYNPVRGVFGSPLVGLDNFINVFGSAELPRILRNSLGISVIGFIVGFPLTILFSLLINEMNAFRFKKLVQTVSYLPHFVSWVVVSGIAYDILDYDGGTVNHILGLAGLNRIDFLAEPLLFWPVSVAIAVWKELGWASIIFISAMASVDADQHEAAYVEGANRFQRISFVTIPGIMPTISLVLILQAGAILSGAGISPGFEGVYNLWNPVVGEYADILDIWMFQEGVKRTHYSFAAAAGLLLSVIHFFLVLAANKIANRINDLGVM